MDKISRNQSRNCLLSWSKKVAVRLSWFKIKKVGMYIVFDSNKKCNNL